MAASRLPFDYFAIRNGCVSTQRLHHCVSTWPCGQALSLFLGPLTARVARRAATFQLHFSLALRPSTCFLSFGPLTARVARRVSVPQLLAITMLSLCGWPHLHDCLQITLRSSMAVCPHSDCIIAFQLGLAAKRSLYHLGRLPPALRGVQRLSHFAFQPGLPAKLMFSILRPAHHPRCAERQHASSIAIEMLSAVGRIFTIAFRLLCDPAMAVCLHSDCIIAFQLGLLRPSVFSP